MRGVLLLRANQSLPTAGQVSDTSTALLRCRNEEMVSLAYLDARTECMQFSANGMDRVGGVMGTSMTA